MSKETKLALYKACQDYAQSRIDEIKLAISSAQNAANSETKSTAGDKHDTARAMMQLDVEQKSKQQAEAEKLKMALAQFSPDSGNSAVGLGSLVQTNAATYYLSISAGKLEIDGKTYFAVSPVSPIAQAMKGKVAGDNFSFNGRSFEIQELF